MSLYAELFKETILEFYRKNVPFLAAAVSYYVFLALVPFFLLLVSAAGMIGNYLPALGIDLKLFLGALLGKYGSQVYDFVQNVINRRFGYGITGLIALAIGFSFSLTPVEEALKIIFEEKRSKPFFKQRFFGLLFFVLILLLLLLAAIVLVVVQGILRVLERTDMFARVLIDLHYLYRLTEFLLPLFFLGSVSLLFYFVYRFLTVKRPSRRNAIIAAVIAAVLLELARQGYLFYLARFPVYDLIYGAFSFFIVTLIFIYLAAAIFLFGAVLLKRLEKIKNL